MHSIERRAGLVAAALLLLVSHAWAQAPTPSQAPTPDAPLPRAIDLLEATGLNYSKNTPTSWVIRYQGDNGDTFPVIIAQAPEMLVLISVMGLGTETRDSLELYRELLEFNSDADYVKVAIDDDGDYLIRTDVGLATLTAPELKGLLDQTAHAVNKLRPLFAKHKKQ